MSIYRFSFDNKYAGHTATVTNTHTQTEVSGSPITLDADGDGTLDLTQGNYRAQVDNTIGAFGDGYSVVDGIFDIEASIEAAGGTSGLVLDGPMFAFECMSGMDIVGNGQPLSITWDTAYTSADGFGDWPESAPLSMLQGVVGIYIVDVEVDFDSPAEDRVALVFAKTDGTDAHRSLQGAGQSTILANCDAGQVMKLSAVVRLQTTDMQLVVNVQNSPVVNATVAPLHVNYAALTLTKIG